MKVANFSPFWDVKGRDRQLKKFRVQALACLCRNTQPKGCTLNFLSEAARSLIQVTVLGLLLQVSSAPLQAQMDTEHTEEAQRKAPGLWVVWDGEQCGSFLISF